MVIPSLKHLPSRRRPRSEKLLVLDFFFFSCFHHLLPYIMIIHDDDYRHVFLHVLYALCANDSSFSTCATLFVFIFLHCSFLTLPCRTSSWYRRILSAPAFHPLVCVKPYVANNLFLETESRRSNEQMSQCGCMQKGHYDN